MTRCSGEALEFPETSHDLPRIREATVATHYSQLPHEVKHSMQVLLYQNIGA